MVMQYPSLLSKSDMFLVQIDVDDYLEERDASIRGVMDGFTLGMHNNIYFDLFGHGMFYPLVQMNISYDIDDENVNPVYYGNEISPSEVNYRSEMNC